MACSTTGLGLMTEREQPTDDQVTGDYRLIIPDPRNFQDFLGNLLHPGWDVVWASDEAQRRHQRWADTKGLRCPGCGARILIEGTDGNLMHPPEWWWDESAPDRPEGIGSHPYCDDCHPKTIAPLRLPLPPV